LFCILSLLAFISRADAGNTIKLQTGETVEALGLGRIYTGDTPALALKYRTLLPLDDKLRLRKEIDAIWNLFVNDVERSDLSAAMIMAHGPEKGFIITTSDVVIYVFEKRRDSWRTRERDATNGRKLDEQYVRAFLDRLDWVESHNLIFSRLLYMADDWTKTVHDKTRSDSESTVIDREQYTDQTYSALKTATDFQSRRKIDDIQIGNDAQRAIVRSQVSESITINGVTHSGTALLTDVIEIRGPYTLWTKSSAVIEQRAQDRAN